MATFRFTVEAQRGETVLFIEEAETLEAAEAKCKLHAICARLPSTPLKAEVKIVGLSLSMWVPIINEKEMQHEDQTA